MIYIKDNPVGVDAAIDRCQQRIARDLTWQGYDLFSRLYLNQREGRTIAEAYIREGEYEEAFVDDRVAKIGFVVDDKREGSQIQSVKVNIVCSADVTKIFGLTSREDEAAMLQLLKIVSTVGGWEMLGLTTGNVDSVFSFMDRDAIRYRDMQPYVNFSIQCNVKFINNICNF